MYRIQCGVSVAAADTNGRAVQPPDGWRGRADMPRVMAMPQEALWVTLGMCKYLIPQYRRRKMPAYQFH